MKRSNKLSLKAETIRQLTNVELGGVEGGANTGYCRTGGGADQDSGSKPTPERSIVIAGNWQQNYQYGP